MSNILKFPEVDKIEEVACGWIARLDAANMTEEEQCELQVWIAADPQHQRVLLEMATLLDQMTVVSSLKKILPLNEVAMVERASVATTAGAWRGALPKLALAAAVAVVALIFTLNWQQADTPEVALNFHTAVGEIRTVTLADGSLVTMNSNSAMTVAFSGKQRRINLNHGEAMFQVAHDASRQFVVAANGNEVHAIGTAFNVNLANAALEITVTEGVVEILSKLDLLAPAPETRSEALNNAPARLMKKKKFLVAGEAMTIDNTLVDSRAVDAETIDAKLSWQRGQLVFRGESLEYVVAQVSRYSEHSLTITDDEIRSIRVGGVFEAGDVDDLVDVLEESLGIAVRKTADGNYYLSAKKAKKN